MSGDMGEIFNAMKQNKKESKQKRFLAADDTGWSKHTTHHWYRETPKGRLNYWPSTGLCMLNGKRHNIKGKFVKGLLASIEGSES